MHWSSAQEVYEIVEHPYDQPYALVSTNASLQPPMPAEGVK